MLACVQLLTRLGVPSAVAWLVDGAVLVAAGAVVARLHFVARRAQPPVVAEAELILAEADARGHEERVPS